MLNFNFFIGQEKNNSHNISVELKDGEILYNKEDEFNWWSNFLSRYVIVFNLHLYSLQVEMGAYWGFRSH